MAVIIGTGFGLAPPFWAGREGSRHHARIYSAASTSTSKYITSIYKCVPPTNEGAPSSFLARNAPTCGTADSPTCRLGSWGGICLVVQRSQRDPKKGGVCMLSQGKYRFLHAKQEKKKQSSIPTPFNSSTESLGSSPIAGLS